MTKNVSKYLEGNWTELKGKVKSKWAKLTDDDLLLIEGSYDQLVGKLEELYGQKMADAESEVLAFLAKHGFGKKLSKAEDEFDDEADSFRELIHTYMDDYFHQFKEKSAYLGKKSAEYAQENPLKLLGMAAVGGFLLAKLVSSKN